MKKSLVNKYLGMIGLEMHGKGYIQSVLKKSFKEDAYVAQKELIGIKDPIIFDVGANRGDTVKKYASLLPDASIYAFEPFLEIFSEMKKRFMNDSQIHCYPLALAENEGQRHFYVNKNVDTNSLLQPIKAGLSSDAQVRNESVITVNTISLQQFCESNKISFIDILKMDTQGGELGILKGAETLLKAKKISMIYTEIYFVRQYNNQPLFHDIVKYLFEFDFILQDIYSPIYGNRHLAWADAIFTLKS